MRCQVLAPCSIARSCTFLATVLCSVQAAPDRGEQCVDGFVWLAQGHSQPPVWLWGVAADADSHVVFGSFDESCRGSFELPRARLVCIPSTSWSQGRNSLYRTALEWEKERSCRFLYIIHADENAGFDFWAECTPEGCGDSRMLPQAAETAHSFFQRLLSSEQPAVATPIDFLSFRCGIPGRVPVRVCTSNIDGKLQAFHWSAHEILLPYVEDFEHVSMWASLCLMEELIESAFVGYAVVYRMFERLSPGSSLPQRAEYIRNAGPCVPIRYPDGGFEDSAVVSWLRPRLRRCASKKLGSARSLQDTSRLMHYCQQDTCKLNAVCGVGGCNVNYAQLPCLPWARRWQTNATKRCTHSPWAGRDRPPLRSSLSFELDFYSDAKAKGWADLQVYERQGTFKRLPVCHLARSSFGTLVRSFEGSVDNNNMSTVSALDISTSHAYVLRKTANRMWGDAQDKAIVCGSLCLCVFLGASYAAANLGHERAGFILEHDTGTIVECMGAFIREWSLADVAQADWAAPFEMMLWHTQDTTPPSSRLDWWEQAPQMAASWEFTEANHDIGHLSSAVSHLLQAVTSTEKRFGHLVAATYHVKHLTHVFHFHTAIIWALYRYVVKLGMRGFPAPLSCGSAYVLEARGE